VRATGIEHITLPWREDAILLIGGSPATAAGAAWQLESRIGVGEGRALVGASVDLELVVTPATFRVVRVADRRWSFLDADTGEAVAVELDEDGIPVVPAAISWPLELEHDH
jgi:hypothetical protein